MRHIVPPRNAQRALLSISLIDEERSKAMPLLVVHTTLVPGALAE